MKSIIFIVLLLATCLTSCQTTGTKSAKDISPVSINNHSDNIMGV